MDLALVRHAEPVRVDPGGSGPADPPLTDAGRRQAARLADWLGHEPVDVVLASPLRRALETAQPVAEQLGRTVEIVDGLAEYDRDADHYIPVDQLRRDDPDRWRAMVEGRWEDYGAESPDTFVPRMHAALDGIIAAHAGARVVAVGHGGWINVALASVIGHPRVLWFEPGYTSIHRIRAARFGPRSIVSVNETAHLEARREPLGTRDLPR